MKQFGIIFVTAIVLMTFAFSGCNNTTNSDTEGGFTPGVAKVVGNQIIHENPKLTAYGPGPSSINADTGAATLKAGDGNGFSYKFPAGLSLDWKDCRDVKIEYTLTIITGNPKVIIKDGNESWDNIKNSITGDEIYPTLQTGEGKSLTFKIDSFPLSIDGTNTPGISFQHNAGGGGDFTVKVTKITFTEAEAAPQGKQPDGSYLLDPTKFTSWYGAALTDGNTIEFSGGGMNYPFPSEDPEFDINDYTSLVVEYTTSGVTWVDGHYLQITVHTLKGDSSSYVRTNLEYPVLEYGDGTYTLADANFDALQAAGVVGFDFQVNGSGNETTYSMKINSMTLKP